MTLDEFKSEAEKYYNNRDEIIPYPHNLVAIDMMANFAAKMIIKIHKQKNDYCECDKKTFYKVGFSCPKCGSIEKRSNTPRTVYACGSSDYDQRPGTFSQSDKCKELTTKE